MQIEVHQQLARAPITHQRVHHARPVPVTATAGSDKCVVDQLVSHPKTVTDMRQHHIASLLVTRNRDPNRSHLHSSISPGASSFPVLMHTDDSGTHPLVLQCRKGFGDCAGTVVREGEDQWLSGTQG